MVTREQQFRRPQDLLLPDNKTLTIFCEELYEEGLAYDELPQDEVKKLGTHTSIVLHNYPDGTGRWASIHYRENLGQLAKIAKPAARARAFLMNLSVDLHLLAERLLKDLRDVRMIYGLTHLSASWGNRHSFTTEEFTPDPEKIRTHRQSITGLPSHINDQAPLTLFSIERETFIREFHSALVSSHLDSGKKDHSQIS